VSKSNSALTWYVDPINGADDLLHGTGTGTNAFKTIQFAYDSLPDVISSEHQQTIQLADGVHNENYRSAASLPRPAILYSEGKTIRGRTDRSAGRLEAPILIVGNTSDNTAVTIKAATGYDSSVIYNLREQIAFDSLTIEGLSGMVLDELVASHRGMSYIHLNDCVLDGISVSDTSAGLVVESTGQLEMTGFSEIKNCLVGAKTLTNGDMINISADTIIHDCTTGILATGGGEIKLNKTGTGLRVHTCTTGISCQFDSMVILKGPSNIDRLSIESPINIVGGKVSATYTDIESTIDIELGVLDLNNCGHQSTVIANSGSSVRYTGSDTFTTGNTANSSSNPVRIYDGAAIQTAGTNNFVRSGGADYIIGQRLATFTANGQTLTLNEWDKLVLVRGTAANFTGLILSVPTLLNQEVTLFGDSFNADFIDSTTAQFATGGIQLGNSAGVDFASVTLKASDPTASGTLLWLEIGRSPLN
jgi:hypothetical protein